MMYFCPTCANLLHYELPHMERSARLFCRTCPYVCPITTKIKIKSKQPTAKEDLKPIIFEDGKLKYAKDTDDEEELKYAQETEVTCPNCGFKKAAFCQVQIRPADEPAATFYECKDCKHHWREG